MNKYETRQRNNQTEGLKEEYSGQKERGFYTSTLLLETNSEHGQLNQQASLGMLRLHQKKQMKQGSHSPAESESSTCMLNNTRE